MSFQKFKANSYWVGARPRSSTTNTVAYTTNIKKTGKEVKLINGRCSICNRKNQ